MTEETIDYINKLSLRDYIGDIPKDNKIVCPKCNSGLKENRTPALHVYSRKGYCYSCGTSFNIVRYVQYERGLTYWQSLKFLANLYNVSTEVIGKIWHVENKIFYNEKRAREYERKLEMREIIRDEISFRIIINRRIDKLMLIGLVSTAQRVCELYIDLIVLFNRRYGTLHEIEKKYFRR